MNHHLSECICTYDKSVKCTYEQHTYQICICGIDWPCPFIEGEEVMEENDEPTYRLTGKGVILCYLTFDENGPNLPFDKAEEYSGALELELFRQGYVITALESEE